MKINLIKIDPNFSTIYVQKPYHKVPYTKLGVDYYQPFFASPNSKCDELWTYILEKFKFKEDLKLNFISKEIVKYNRDDNFNPQNLNIYYFFSKVENNTLEVGINNIYKFTYREKFTSEEFAENISDVDGFLSFIKYAGKIVTTFENNTYFSFLLNNISLEEKEEYIDSLRKKYKNKYIQIYSNNDYNILFDENKINLFVKYLQEYGFSYNINYLLELPSVSRSEDSDVEDFTLLILLFGSFDKIHNNDDDIYYLSLPNITCIKYVFAYIKFILDITNNPITNNPNEIINKLLNNDDFTLENLNIIVELLQNKNSDNYNNIINNKNKNSDNYNSIILNNSNKNKNNFIGGNKNISNDKNKLTNIILLSIILISSILSSITPVLK